MLFFLFVCLFFFSQNVTFKTNRYIRRQGISSFTINVLGNVEELSKIVQFRMSSSVLRVRH